MFLSPYLRAFDKAYQSYSVLKPHLLGLREPSRINTRSHKATHNQRAFGWGGGTSIHNLSPFEKKKWRLVLVTLRGRRKKGGINRRETRAYNGKAKDRYYHAPLFLSPSLASRLRS